MCRETLEDTPTANLHQAGFNLRTRKQNEDMLVTLKGNPKLLSDDVLQRMEIECPWSLGALENVIGILSENNIVLDNCEPKFDTPPHSVLNQLGLDMVQKRRNNRIARDITDTRSKEHVAEIAIDQVTYEFGKDTVCHYELEVEAKGNGIPSDIQSIIDEFKKTYPNDLHPWLHGKLSTGLAIESLCKDNILQGLISRNHSLPMAGYKLIHGFLVK